MDRNLLADEIIDKFFGQVIAWKSPEFIDSPSPQTLGPFLSFEEQRDKALAEVRSLIGRASDNDLDSVQSASPAHSRNQFSDASSQDREIWLQAIGLKPPVWFAGGFGVAGYEADFRYWAQLERWTMDDAVAISIGVEPSSIFPEHQDTIDIDHAVINFFGRRARLIKERFFPFERNQGLSDLSPTKFCKWADDIKLDIPAQLFRAVEEIHGERFGQTSNCDPALDQVSLENRERESLLKLVIGLAIGAYRYDPDAQRSDVPKSIRGDLVEIGLDLSEETIRKWLRKAATILPKGWKGE